jgi:hypothetical protein
MPGKQLFDAGGPLFCFRPAASYVSLNRAASFYSVVEAARRRGEVAVGYWIRSNRNAHGDCRAVLNPAKTRSLALRATTRFSYWHVTDNGTM